MSEAPATLITPPPRFPTSTNPVGSSLSPHINLPLTIRPASFFDLWPAAQSLNRAFANDPLFGDIIHPHRDEHPDDPALWFYDSLRADWFDWTRVYLVAVGRSGDGREVIAGVAQWRRKGERKEVRKWGWGLAMWDPRNLMQPVYSLYLRLLTYLPPRFRSQNLAADPTKVDILTETEQFTKHYWTGQRKSSWYLCLMGVAPEFQYHGVGRALVAWGFDRAREEGVSVSVVAAYGKDRFYQKCGFEQCVGNANEGVGNPLGELECKGGNIWFRDPKMADGDGDEEEKGNESLSWPSKWFDGASWE